MSTEPAARPVELVEVPVDQIATNPHQPRRVFAEEDIEELASSIREVGLLQPVVVRATGTEPAYELVMGERRWRASQLAGLSSIPAIVRCTSDEQMLREALLENLQRVALNPLEEAAAYQQMVTDFDATHDEVAAAVSKSRSHVTHTISLLRLSAPVQRRVAAGVLSAGHAKALLRVPDPSAAERLADRIVAEGLSVRATEEIITLGDLPGWEAERRKTAQRRRAQADPDVMFAAATLGDRLDTRVRIDAGKKKGRIIVEFAGREDLDRLLAMLTPGQD